MYFLSQEIFCQKRTFQNESMVKREGRWMVPMDEYPANHYPSFCSGSGFIISKNATGKIFEVAKIGSILGTLFGVQILDPLLAS